MSNNEEKINAIISTAGEMFGAATGGVLGFFLGGPAGAATAGAAGVAVAKTFIDVANRTLSQREEARVGAVAIYAVEKIFNRLNAGESLRNDSFFRDQQKIKRSNADEIFEGILLKAKEEHEEKKIKHVAFLYANICFEPNISIEESHYLLKVVENMSYRQICLLRIFHDNNSNELNLRKEDYDSIGIRGNVVNIDISSISLLQEITDLGTDGIIGMLAIEREDGFTGGDLKSEYTDMVPIFGWSGVSPSRIRLTHLGTQLFNLIEPPQIDIKDISDVITLLMR